MSATGSPEDSELETQARTLLNGYRWALRECSALRWLPQAFVRHVVASSARVAANRLMTTRELSVSVPLKLFADEAARADPLRHLPAVLSMTARVLPFIGVLAAGAVAGGAALWGLGALIEPHPGLFGLLWGAVWFAIVVLGAATGVFAHVQDRFDEGCMLLEQRVDDHEEKVFAALHEPRPGRALRWVLPAVCVVLWLLLLGLVLAGFVVEHL